MAQLCRPLHAFVCCSLLSILFWIHQRNAIHSASSLHSVAAADETLEEATAPVGHVSAPAHPAARRGVHAFFYLWYKTPAIDGEWQHWNHRILPHWNQNERDRWPHDVRFEPPADFGASFAPRDGLYSSADEHVLARQFAQMREAGVTAAALSWSGRPDVPTAHDGEGVRTDALVPLVMRVAERERVQIIFHLEPYEHRTPETVRLDLEYIVDRYGASPAFYRDAQTRLPFYYVYDSYHNSPEQWGELLLPTGRITIRGDPRLDATMIGIVLDHADVAKLARGGFQGAYPYFAADGFSYAATARNWPALAAACASHSLLFVPSVGPGYDDSRIRPWNAQTRRAREHGAVYARAWAAALGSVSPAPAAVSITSWNEWGEGTQIEPVRPHVTPSGLALADYEPEGGDLYLRLTAEWAAKLQRQ